MALQKIMFNNNNVQLTSKPLRQEQQKKSRHTVLDQKYDSASNFHKAHNELQF